MENLKEQLLALCPETSYHHDRVVFLENSNGLNYEGAADAFREFLIENKIRHNVVYKLEELNDDQLLEVAKECLDTLVVFETTGITGSFGTLVGHFINLTNNGFRFRFLECSTYDFQFYRLPEQLGEGCLSYHNLQCGGGFGSVEEWQLNEVTK